MLHLITACLWYVPYSLKEKSAHFVLIRSWQMEECLFRRLIYWKPDSYQCTVSSDSGPVMISSQ